MDALFMYLLRAHMVDDVALKLPFNHDTGWGLVYSETMSVLIDITELG